MELQTNWLDWFVFLLYLVGVFGFGLYKSGRISRKGETFTDFFLAGRRLPWYAIGFSLYASNISSGSLVGLAGDGYRVGMAVGWLEWHALFSLILLTFVFLPYYQRRSVTTMPEFLELRYNVGARTLFAIAILLFEMVIGMPFLLYTGGLVIEVMFGVPLVWSILAIAVFVGVYTTVGGLGAVVWTDFVQATFMLVGGVVVTGLGLREIGGFDILMAQASEKMHVVLPANHPEYPFPAAAIGGYFLVGIYYWCQNQTIVQRTLGARTEWDARMGAIAACFVKLIQPFLLVLPGVIAFVLFPHLDAADKAFPTLVNEVVPAGLSGLIIAAMVAALMSSADSVINSWGTLFTYDIYRRLIDKGSGPRRLVLVGRLATVFLLSIAVIRAPMLRENESILQFFLNALAYITTPILVLFAVGIFWRRATSAAAVVTILTAPAVCYVAQDMRALTGWRPHQTSIVYWLPMAVAVSVLIVIIVSLFTKTKEPALLKGLIWTRQDTLTFGMELLQRRDAEYAGTPGGPVGRLTIWKDYRLMGFFSLLLMAVLVWWLR